MQETMYHRCRKTQQVSLTVIAVCVALLLVGRVGIPQVSRVSFFVVLPIILFANVFWWSWLNQMLAGLFARCPAGRQIRLTLQILWNAYCLLLLSPVFLFMFRLRHAWDHFPVPLVTWTLIWHFVLFGFGCAAATLFAIRQVTALVRRQQSSSGSDCVDTAPDRPGDPRTAKSMAPLRSENEMEDPD